MKKSTVIMSAGLQLSLIHAFFFSHLKTILLEQSFVCPNTGEVMLKYFSVSVIRESMSDL